MMRFVFPAVAALLGGCLQQPVAYVPAEEMHTVDCQENKFTHDYGPAYCMTGVQKAVAVNTGLPLPVRVEILFSPGNGWELSAKYYSGYGGGYFKKTSVMKHIKESTLYGQDIAWGAEKKTKDISYVRFFAPAKLVVENPSFKSPASCVVFLKYLPGKHKQLPQWTSEKIYGLYCEEDDRPINPARIEAVLAGFTIKR